MLPILIFCWFSLRNQKTIPGALTTFLWLFTAVVCSQVLIPKESGTAPDQSSHLSSTLHHDHVARLPAELCPSQWVQNKCFQAWLRSSYLSKQQGAVALRLTHSVCAVSFWTVSSTRLHQGECPSWDHPLTSYLHPTKPPFSPPRDGFTALLCVSRGKSCQPLQLPSSFCPLPPFAIFPHFKRLWGWMSSKRIHIIKCGMMPPEQTME